MVLVLLLLGRERLAAGVGPEQESVPVDVVNACVWPLGEVGLVGDVV